jgi:hypothetical protein
MKRAPFALLLICTLAGCAPAGGSSAIAPPPPPIPYRQANAQLGDIADAYIRLSLEAGEHEDGYIDAYYGPADLRAAAHAHPRPVAELLAEARALNVRLNATVIPALISVTELRRARMLRAMLTAAETRLRMIGGERLPFAEEARGLFDTSPQLRPLSDYDAVLAQLQSLLPGDAPLAARVDAFNDRTVIPADRLRAVFDAAIAECRRRTTAHITLPEGEQFTLEFVTGKSWSGYNWYQGNYRSLIQVNTDLPVRISRAVDLGCHEGYPGHHVLNLMIEQKLVRAKGWREFAVNPLYSPQSVISEGSANYGIDLAFPGEERLRFERDVLYPLAGLDPATAEAHWRVQQATEALQGARLTIAQQYLDRQIDRARAVALTQTYLLVSAARAEQMIGFVDQYRSYVLNYGWGKQLVRDMIESGHADETTRWARMTRILSQPTLPEDLIPQ